MSITILGRQSTVGFLQSSTKEPSHFALPWCAQCARGCRCDCERVLTKGVTAVKIHPRVHQQYINHFSAGWRGENIVKTALGPSVPIQRPSWNNQQWYFLNGLNGFGLWGLTLYPIGLTSLTRLHSEVNARVSSPSSSARPSLLQVTWRYDARGWEIFMVSWWWWIDPM